jgi:hypothetical protein
MPCSAYIVMSSSRYSIPSYDFLIPIPYVSPALETISFPPYPLTSQHSPPIPASSANPTSTTSTSASLLSCFLLFQTAYPTNQPKKHPANSLSRLTSSTSSSMSRGCCVICGLYCPVYTAVPTHIYTISIPAQFNVQVLPLFISLNRW